MDELVKMVTEKAGISSDQAQKAVTTVLGFLKGKLPGPVAGQIDNVVSGQSGSEGGIAGEAGKAVGGMFGR